MIMKVGKSKKQKKKKTLIINHCNSEVNHKIFNLARVFIYFTTMPKMYTTKPAAETTSQEKNENDSSAPAPAPASPPTSSTSTTSSTSSAKTKNSSTDPTSNNSPATSPTSNNDGNHSSSDSESGSSDGSDSSGSDSDSENEDMSQSEYQMNEGLLGRVIQVKKHEMNEHLVCVLCNGYYRDAHTVQECLHTFCKSCIYLHVRKSGNHKCPHESHKFHGDISLGNDLQNVRADHTLQSIVGKLFPEYGPVEDSKNEVLFYQKKGIKRKRQPPKPKPVSKQKMTPAPTPKQSPANSSSSSSGSSSSRSDNSNQNMAEAGKQIDMPFQLLPDRSKEELILDTLSKPYLRTASLLTIGMLSKFLHHKLKIDSSRSVEVTCLVS
jgi:hypothetical protein